MASENGTGRLGKEGESLYTRGDSSLHPTPCSELSPVHDDVHVAAVPLEAGAQQDLITSGEAHLHGVVGNHLGVGLQHGLELQQGLLGLLPALSPGETSE